MKQFISEFAMGGRSRTSVLEELMIRSDKIDETTGKSLIAELSADQDSAKAAMLQKGRRDMEELIRDKDPISGAFTDDRNQILAAAEAYLMFDAEVTKAAQAGKALTGREAYQKAIEIALSIKEKIPEDGDYLPGVFNYPTQSRFGVGAGFEPPPGMEPRVNVIAPDGTRGTIPPEDVEEALKQGYKID
jgi:hypothetical protein